MADLTYKQGALALNIVQNLERLCGCRGCFDECRRLSQDFFSEQICDHKEVRCFRQFELERLGLR